jgi:hypothetical protein
VKTRVLKLTRVTALPDAGGGTLFFKAPGLTRQQRYLFFQPGAVPAFEGTDAWFLAEREPGGGWRLVQRVNADGSPHVERPTGDA